jgi:hypothetical protein
MALFEVSFRGSGRIGKHDGMVRSGADARQIEKGTNRSLLIERPMKEGTD